MAKNITLLSTLACLTVLSASLPALSAEAFATRNINIRSGPGLQFEVVDQLVKGEPVDKRNCNTDNSWCYINHDGPGGWVAAVFLTNSLTPVQPPVVQPTPPASGNNYFANAQVNVRTGPGTQFAIVDRLEARDQLKRGQCTSDGKWCYVDHKGADGWVAASFLSPINSQPVDTGDTGIDTSFTPAQFIARSPVNVRSGPGLNFSVMDRLDQNEEVTRNQCLPDGSWCYITHTGPDGWVAASFIAPKGNYQPPQKPTKPTTPTTTLRYGTAISGMPVRNSPSLFTGTSGRLERGDTVKIDQCSSDGYWCHVTNNNVQGWVPQAFLTISEPVVQPTPKPTPTPVPGDRSAITTKRVFLRDGPGLDNPIIGTISGGSKVEIDQCNAAGDWCFVSRNDRSGWITTEFLDLPPDSAPAPTQPTTPNAVCFEGLGGLRICLQ